MKTYLAVFGATGNLMYKKLLPAIAALQAKNLLPKDTTVLCIGRANHSIDSYLSVAKEQIKEKINWELFTPLLEYFQMELQDIQGYQRLFQKMYQEGPSIRLFYLAVAPDLFPMIAKGINEANLIAKNDPTGRIVFEKPFGEDLKSAQAINSMLWNYFDESQIYRVDHYLGKEMIQNILVVRFANQLFENSWNHHSIERVIIIAKETEGIMNRGNYYDHVGALKDMVQSHLMQMAALIAMEIPESFDVDGIRAEKVKVLKKINIAKDDVLTGQYLGYLNENNILKDSQTETFVFLKAMIDTPRWKDVPFYFITGKKLDEKRSEIILDFKQNSQQNNLWPNRKIEKNRLVIRVAPGEGVTFRLNTKEHGLSTNIRPMEMDYCHDCEFVGNKPEAYERLLLDLISGNSTLFTRWDEIETSWKNIDNIYQFIPKPIVYTNFKDLKQAIKSQFGEVLE
jgi:glucose-6-phosphate 1-dehydrogenase